MKARLFALFCVTLFVLSVPQALAQDSEPQVPEELINETPVEVPSTPVEEAQPAEPTEAPVEPEEPATEASSDDDEQAAAAEEPPVTAAAETEEKESDSDEVDAEPVVAEKSVTETEPEPEVAPVTTEITPESQQGPAEEAEVGGSNDAPQTSENAVVAEPEAQTEAVTAPAEPTETTDATNPTNPEPAAPVSVPEDSQQETAATEESHETVPVAEGEEGKDGLGFFGLIGRVLIGAGVLALIILVGCVYNYRYQMKKYKMAPFTPPSFLPECLFPRSTESTGRLVSGYTELQVGNYQAAPRFAEV